MNDSVRIGLMALMVLVCACGNEPRPLDGVRAGKGDNNASDNACDAVEWDTTGLWGTRRCGSALNNYFKIDFRTASALPSNMRIFFTDYPEVEDDKQPELDRARSAFFEEFQQANGRYPTFDEVVAYENLHMGYWLRSGLRAFEDGTPLPEHLENPGFLLHFEA